MLNTHIATNTSRWELSHLTVYSPNSFPATGVLAVLIERLVVGPGCRAPSAGQICYYLLELVTPTFKTRSVYDCFLQELHLSWEVLQELLPKAFKSPRWPQMIPDYPRWSQMSLMSPDDPRPRWFQMSPDDPRWSQMILDDPRWSQMVPDDSRWSQARWSQMIPDPVDPRWSQMLPNPDDPRWSQMIPDDPRYPRWSKMIPDDPRRDDLRWFLRWSQMIPDDPRPRWS